MTKTSRARYTLEFKQEAVRLVENGQSIAAAARTLGVVDQTLFHWVGVVPDYILADDPVGSQSKLLQSSQPMLGIDSWASESPERDASTRRCRRAAAVRGLRATSPT